MPSTGLDDLLGLFNHKKKKDLDKYCRTLVIQEEAFVKLVLAGRAGILEPYQYSCSFFERVPEQLYLSTADFDSVATLAVGELDSAGKRFFNKVIQTFEHRRLFAAHLFYSPCQTFWYLFYFDQRDRDAKAPHWKYGAHIHLISDHFGLPLKRVWEGLIDEGKSFPSLHLRFEAGSEAE